MNRPRQRRVVLNNSADTLTSNSIDSTHIINGSILGTVISDGTITEANLETAVQTKLNATRIIAPNSINSTHIINGSILGTDISNGTITEANLETSVQTKLNAGGGLAPNSINSTHIITGSILGTDISNGSLSLENIDNPFKYIIDTYTIRINNLEKFSIQRTLDVVVTSVNSHNINIDLSTYESVQIDFLLKFTGPANMLLRIQPVNVGSVGTWTDYNGTIVGGNSGTPTTLTSSANNGTVLHRIDRVSASIGFTASISCKIFKVYDLGVHSGRYLFTATGLYAMSGVGQARSEITAMTNSYLPTALNISLSNGAGRMFFSYSIINDTLITSI